MMMNNGGKRKLSTIIIGKMNDKPSDMSEKPVGTKSDSSIGLEVAASKLLKGFESKDSSIIASALKEAFAMCEAEDEIKSESTESYSDEPKVG